MPFRYFFRTDAHRFCVYHYGSQMSVEGSPSRFFDTLVYDDLLESEVELLCDAFQQLVHDNYKKYSSVANQAFSEWEEEYRDLNSYRWYHGLHQEVESEIDKARQKHIAKKLRVKRYWESVARDALRFWTEPRGIQGISRLDENLRATRTFPNNTYLRSFAEQVEKELEEIAAQKTD